MATSSFSTTTDFDGDQAEAIPPASSGPIFISCIRGLETHLMHELKALGLGAMTPAPAGVRVAHATLEQAVRVCYGSRLALRVLWQIHAFRLWKQQNLYQQTVKQDWKQWLVERDGATLRNFKIAVSGKSRHFANTHFCVQRTKDAVCDHMIETFGKRPDIEKQLADVRIQVHLEDDQATLYFDMSGEPLNQRGYRRECGEAPLNEVMAASLLALAGYDGYRPFCDPCCGSGTLLLEAGMIKTHTPAGYLRREWGFEKHPLYTPEILKEVRSELNAKIEPLPSGWLTGIDQDSYALRQAQTNCRALGWEGIEWHATPFQRVKLSEKCFILTNPPFGKRLENSSLDRLYADLGQFFCDYASRAFLFSSSEELLDAVKLHVLQSFKIDFSGQLCFLERFKVIKKREIEQEATPTEAIPSPQTNRDEELLLGPQL